MSDKNQPDESLHRYKNLVFADDSWKQLADYGVSREMIAQTITMPREQLQTRKGTVFVRRFNEHEVDAIAALSEDGSMWNVSEVWGYSYYKEFVFPISILVLMQFLHVTPDMVVTTIKHPDQREAEPERGDMEPEVVYWKQFNNRQLRVDAFLDEDRLKIMVADVQLLPGDKWWQRIRRAIQHLFNRRNVSTHDGNSTR